MSENFDEADVALAIEPDMPMPPFHGLKNHQIAGLVSAITKYLHKQWPQLPESLREHIKHPVHDYLRGNNLMLDSSGEE